MKFVDRGGQPDNELSHASYLLEKGAEDVWGWGSAAGQERVRARVRWIAEECALGPGVRVLECGCGTGVFTRQLAQTGALITAVDISQDLLEQARKLCPHRNVTFLKSNLEDFVDSLETIFDAVYGVSVLHHLRLPQGLLVIGNKLRMGARFCFSEPNLLNPINRYFNFTQNQEKRRARGISPTEMAFRPAELRSLFERTGYEVESLCHRDFLHPVVLPSLIPLVKVGQFVAERTPLIRRWSGSLWISGRKV